jgi:hypothetical protein
MGNNCYGFQAIKDGFEFSGNSNGLTNGNI